MNVPPRGPVLRSALGAGLAVLSGWLLWKSPLGDPWVNASYDYLFRFGSKAGTNPVVLVLMDNEAFDQLHQSRAVPWSRALHAELLRKLAADECALVVLDTFFRHPGEARVDAALVEALHQQRAVVLMAEQARVTHPNLAGARPTLPAEPFLSAAGGNWGVAWLDPDLDWVVRRHWPFPSPGPYPSLAWRSARLAGATLGESPCRRWLRYYDEERAWEALSYRFALAQPTNFFRGKIVFIGTRPKTTVPDGEPDEFMTPHTRWSGETVGGVEIMLTAFLNLMNQEWLERPLPWIEGMVLFVTGVFLGGGLCRLQRPVAATVAIGVGILMASGAVSWSHLTNYWFPWLVVVGGQVPVALGWALLLPTPRPARIAVEDPEAVPNRPMARAGFAPESARAAEEVPVTPDYELIHPPFGQGAYGKVWLARSAIGQWQALKTVYAAKFREVGPYEREFNGIRRYKPVSHKHPGLLRVDFVSKQRPDYFYYVMELGDPLAPGWEREPSSYRPRDLAGEWARSPGRRLPPAECVRIAIALSGALDFLHRHGLTHRDIKPQNIIFVDGQPKLADVGLVAEIRPRGEAGTYVGTPGYLPPSPESPGTSQADIYALGMVLYVLSTGRDPTLFPEITATLVAAGESSPFLPLNAVILKACQPEAEQRYASAAEMHQALLHIHNAQAGDAGGRL